MKKITSLLCAVLLVTCMPIAAFGEVPEVSSEIVPSAVDSDLGATDRKAGDGWIIEITKTVDLKSGGVVAGTITGFEVTIHKWETGVTGFRGPNTAEAPKPYAIDKSKTVLNAAGFLFQLAQNLNFTHTVPDGASIVYTYQADQNLVNDLARENDIEPSDIKLYVYEQDTYNGQAVQKLVNGWPADKPVEVKSDDLHTGTFVMALACDTSLLNKSQSRSGSSSETFVGIDPVDIPSVAAGEDESDLSPKTGQSLPAGTAPAALLVAGVLGGAAVIAARRRWSVR